MSLAEKLASERRGRLAAERMLELKQAELHAANRKLGLHARALSEEINETRAEVATVRTENERVKSDLTVAHQKIEVAERRLWHSINTIQDWFAFFDNDDCLISANEAYLVAFDGLEEVTTGVQYARILQLLTEEGIVNTEGQSQAAWRASMLDRRQSENPEPVVVRLWNDQYVKMVDHRNATGDLISLGLNITSTVIYERELKQSRAKAEEAARAKSAFLANMSHEIRTPMNGVVGMAELLADSGLNEEQSLYTETIRNSGEALLVIINDILDYSKIEAEKLVLIQSEFDFEKTIQEVLMLLQPAAREKNISLLLDYDMFLSRRLIGDVGRVRQILTNLIGNAVKFTLEGHVLVRVSGIPADHTQETTLHVAIEDTGIGIPKNKVEHIFGEFTQVDDERNRQFEGTGLGLAITQRLIKLMRGDVWVTSEEGVGSCFGFRIVLDRIDGEGAAPPQLPAALSRVMVIDDNVVNREILIKQLACLSVTADGYPSGAEALDGIRYGYDLIITDHIMPVMSGIDFVEELRRRGDSTPVIMISSNIGGLNKPDARKEIASILQRPVSRDVLIATLNELGATLTRKEPPETVAAEPIGHPPGVAPASQPSDPPVAETAPSPLIDGSQGEASALEKDDALPSEDPVPATPLFRARKRSTAPSNALQPSTPAATAPDVDASQTLPLQEPVPPAPTCVTAPVSEIIEVHAEPSVVPSPPNPDLAAHALRAPTEEQPDPLPNTEPSEASVAQPAGPSHDSGLEPRRMRVLAAEDNKTNQLVFRKMVKHLDIDLTFANNGLEAVERHGDMYPDLIFMDISMPHMDGKEATRTIRAAEAASGAHVPIVALTAHAMTGDSDPILQAGLDHYLTKPLRKPAIQEMILRYAPTDALSPLPEQEQAQAS